MGRIRREKMSKGGCGVRVIVPGSGGVQVIVPGGGGIHPGGDWRRTTKSRHNRFRFSARPEIKVAALEEEHGSGEEEEHGVGRGGEKHGGSTEEDVKCEKIGSVCLFLPSIAREVTFLPFHVSAMRVFRGVYSIIAHGFQIRLAHLIVRPQRRAAARLLLLPLVAARQCCSPPPSSSSCRHSRRLLPIPTYRSRIRAAEVANAPEGIHKCWEGVEKTTGVGQGGTRLYATVDLGKARLGWSRPHCLPSS
uniref:Uncharacterized protein n=1 Tax=Oryza barthii TaxID=65489 RepID=A0A0D3G5X9_9ORYZ